MPYNPEVIENMLPNPGFTDEDLKTRINSSFPGQTHRLMTTFTNVHSSITGVYKKNADDLTFIIPYATSDAERKWGLLATVAWILSTTTAKIIILSAENKDTYNIFSEPEMFTEDVPITWSQYSSKSFSNEKKSEYIINEIHNGICRKLMASYMLKTDFGVDILRNPEYVQDILNRVKVIVSPRKKNELFHRTKYLNMMLNEVDTEYVCNHDADTILSSHGLLTSMSYLRLGTADVVYPYERGIKTQKRIFFKEASPPGPLNTLIFTGDMSVILHDIHGMMSWPAAYGQSIIFKTSSYKSMGGENENFISWGAEDLERYSRAIKLGLTVSRVDAPIVHIEHPRGSDSSSKHAKFENNESLCDKLLAMSIEELQDYYSKVEYVEKYGWNKSSKEANQ